MLIVDRPKRAGGESPDKDQSTATTWKLPKIFPFHFPSSWSHLGPPCSWPRTGVVELSVYPFHQQPETVCIDARDKIGRWDLPKALLDHVGSSRFFVGSQMIGSDVYMMFP